MKNLKRVLIYISIIFLVLVITTGCRVIQGIEDPENLEVSETPSSDVGLPLEMVEVGGQQIRQWAIEAEASSEYATPEWAAFQATGPPDTDSCGDYQTAWASAGSDSVAYLIVRFSDAVHVTQVNIIETFNPNQVKTVELLGSFERNLVIYDKPPFPIDQPCPYTLSVPVQMTDEVFDAIRITLDQTELGLGWNQIDAVELIGTE